MRISDWSSDVCSSDLLAHLDTVLAAVIADHAPTAAAVEEVFVNDNPQSTLKLAHARGVALLACARAGLPVAEYAPRLVKKAIVGTGGAAKAQVPAMLRILLPGAKIAGADAAHALAGPIPHAHTPPPLTRPATVDDRRHRAGSK